MLTKLLDENVGSNLWTTICAVATYKKLIEESLIGINSFCEVHKLNILIRY